MNKKIKQIATERLGDKIILVALCEDNSIWVNQNINFNADIIFNKKSLGAGWKQVECLKEENDTVS